MAVFRELTGASEAVALRISNGVTAQSEMRELKLLFLRILASAVGAATTLRTIIAKHLL
tara:strand:- start:209 stop:385 length:177 start_codon:yes stop_codon:yes gene_type:complete